MQWIIFGHVVGIILMEIFELPSDISRYGMLFIKLTWLRRVPRLFFQASKKCRGTGSEEPVLDC